MELVWLNPLVQHGVDRFDGTQAFRSPQLSLGVVGPDDISCAIWASVSEGALRPTFVIMFLSRLGSTYSWTRASSAIALADGVRMRPEEEPSVSAEVDEDGLIDEMATVVWTASQFLSLAFAEHPEIRVGVTEIDLRPASPAMRALAAAMGLNA